MNKKLTFVFMFLLTVTANAQTSVYHPFPDSNAYWNVWLNDLDCDLHNTYDERFSYVFGGDTIINTQTYHKIYKPIIQITGCSASMGQFTQYNYSGLKGCIRQDTLNKMVYVVARDSTNEQTLYDFNLQVNDTLKGFANNECNATKKIISIDSILIGSNYRKRFNLSLGFGFYIIEGIGSSVGLLDF